MFDKILVGYDGSKRSVDAVVLSRRLAALGAGQMIGAYVRLLDANGRHAGTPTRPPNDILVRTVRGLSAAHALCELAESEAFDLVVIGSSNRGRVGRGFPGSTADRLLHSAPCPIAVAPAGYSDSVPKAFSRIGAAVCPDPEAIHALQIAATIAKTSGAKLDVVGAFPGPALERFEYGDLGSGEVLVNVRESAQADLEDVTRSLGDGLAATAQLFDGSPTRVLVEHGAELDLLVMGSHGYGPLGRVLLGSVSHDVIRYCPVPVLVVPLRNERSVIRSSGTDVGVQPE